MMRLLFLNLFLLTSCATKLSPEVTKILVVESDPPASCKRIGEIVAKNVTMERAHNDLRQLAHELKGNYVKIMKEEKSSFSYRYEGAVFQCDNLDRSLSLL